MKIAINGFGRTGRMFFRHAFGRPELTVVAVNDLADAENLAYLLRRDTVYGPYSKSVEVHDGTLIVGGAAIKVFAESDPSRLPWASLGVDVVIEATGVFTKEEEAKA